MVLGEGDRPGRGDLLSYGVEFGGVVEGHYGNGERGGHGGSDRPIVRWLPGSGVGEPIGGMGAVASVDWVDGGDEFLRV